MGPRLARLLALVLALFALLSVDSVYLSSITLLEWATGETYQNYFYQYMFLGHLALGVAITLPVIVFGVLHIRNARGRRNRRAVRAGYALFGVSLLLLGTGFVLTRLDVFGVRLEVKSAALRNTAYWTHVVCPLLVAWLFVLHRLAGKPIRWRVGGAWAGVAAAFALAMVLLHSNDPRQWNVVGPASGEQYFFPSLARTSDGNFIPAAALSMDHYCQECHADVHADWSNSVHRFASFNNPAYLASVRETRAAMMERDGDVQGARFCAGCHDLVPFFSGAFDDPDFDDVNHPTAQAGITCTGCHAITHVNSPRGNADYTIEEPAHYPFAFSENPLLRWVNRQLVKAKPAFHKKTFLKPLHKTAEFCGTCHKVHLPEELNGYKWLRGQNHYDSYHLSGVSGHGVASFYYPPVAEESCNGCHMPTVASNDFGARVVDDSGEPHVHRHLFPSANTAMAALLDLDPAVIEDHQEFNEGVLRVDLFGLRAGGTIDGALTAPLGPEVPALVRGQDYLVEVVIRTLKMGHHLTQGTADSNELWLDVRVESEGRTIGRSGGLRADGEVDRWSHFANAYVIDRDGRRISRRNAEDIFLPLYDHQIPPGAGDVVHYLLSVPDDAGESITATVNLRYRKFDREYMQFFEGEAFDGNDLPILEMAQDSVTFMVVDAGNEPVGRPDGRRSEAPEFPTWQRWNDYGIGLLRKGDSGPNRGELRQAEEAFRQVESLGRPDGPLNLARVYLKEGRLEDAVAALQRAARHDPPAPAWSVAWFTGLVNKQNGFLDEAITSFRGLVNMDTEETRRRGFDFSQDYRVLVELGQTLLERSKAERGEARAGAREALLREALQWFQEALVLDPENLSAHYNLALVHDLLGEEVAGARHRTLHQRYKPDDNARGRAVHLARAADPAADHAANDIVIYDLHRPGADELPAAAARPKEGR